MIRICLWYFSFHKSQNSSSRILLV